MLVFHIMHVNLLKYSCKDRKQIKKLLITSRFSSSISIQHNLNIFVNLKQIDPTSANNNNSVVSVL